MNAYGWSKHVVDRRLAREVERGHHTPPQWVGFKFFNVFGPNEYHKGPMKASSPRLFPTLAKERRQALQIPSLGLPDGGQLRDFVYVKDAVNVVLWFLDHPQASGLFNVGTGQARSFADLVRSLFAATGQPERIEYIEMPIEIREKYQYFTQADLRKLRDAGCDLSFHSLEAGVSDYVQQHLSQENPYAGQSSYTQPSHYSQAA